MRIKDGMVKCSKCKKLFLYNPQSIYKLNGTNGAKHYCSYTCWRASGGDSGKKR